MRPRALDVLTEPLAGIRLVEASAGTGKTHTLTDLYLRLVLEGGFSVEAILVVTFTVAATAELRDRIRRRLETARAAVLAGHAAPDDAVMAGLLARLADPAAAARRLARALVEFDQAAVLTIHGFCQRVLTEHAFEGGQPFEAELIPDESALLQEVVDDFWRKSVVNASPFLVRHLLKKQWSPDGLAKAIRPWLGKPYLAVVPLPPAPEGEAEFLACFHEARAVWAAERAAIAEVLAGARLNATRFPRAKLAAWLGDLDTFFASGAPRAWNAVIEKFCAARIQGAALKGAPPASHPFFDACERLVKAQQAFEECLERGARSLRLQLYRYAVSELALRKARRQVLAYQDQLVRLDQALDRRPELAEKLRSRFGAALIDEFQDTDPIQYRIFRAIYAGGAAPVFYVGDPKQAIFGFRGADVFTYLAAGRDVSERRSLDRNWRSAPALVQAVNAVFRRARDPFLFREIAFLPVTPASRPRTTLAVEGDDGPPLRIWRLAGAHDGQITKGEAQPAAIRATVAEIARLLDLAGQGKATIGEAPMRGGHIAVLVRTNRQAEAIRAALVARGIGSVQLGETSVYQTPEAADLERLLRGIAEPEREDRLRAALATDLIGLDGNALEALGEDEAGWEARLAAFTDYQTLWREQGLLPMLRQLFRRERVAARLLVLADGERRLTNLLHVAELLQAAASAERLTIAGVIRRLGDLRRDPPPDEAAQLRLESDEDLVKIATIHKSKGLEYPIVFCPFLWDVSLRAAEDDCVLFHDPVNGAATLDPGSDRIDEARVQADREALAEHLRLTYVALTRAEHRCTLVWGSIHGGEESGLAYLFHQPDAPAELEAIRARAKGLSDAELGADLAQLVAASGGTIAVEPAPHPVTGPAARMSTAPTLQARTFAGVIPEGWRVTSFTGLTAGQRDEADDDPGAREEDTPPGAPDIFAFPRGARAGIFLHAVFAAVDFASERAAERRAIVSRLMREHGIGLDWEPVAAQAVERALQAPLDPALPSLSLGGLPRERRLSELQFFYPLADRDPERLLALFAGQGWAPAGGRVDPVERLRGFMTGAIDLVFEHEGRFYLADYKSNWLGAEAEAYRPERLAATMQREGYLLQSTIYLLALHRYLGRRLPEYDPARHLGGAFYLFLRGMDMNHPGSGVHRHAPDPSIISELDRLVGR